MPYDEIPTENAPALEPQPDEYTFTFTFNGRLPPNEDGTPGKRRTSLDDLELFSTEGADNKRMLDFLDRVITDVQLRGRSLGPGVRKHDLPHECFQSLMKGVGEQLKAIYNPKN